jgi:hypothetical protein
MFGRAAALYHGVDCTFFEGFLCIWPVAGGKKIQALKACYVFGPPQAEKNLRP